MADVQPESALDEAMAQIQGWLDGELILSRAAVRTLMIEMQHLRAQNLQEREHSLEKALEEGKNKPLRWRLPSSPQVPWAADDFLVSATGIWELDRFWAKVEHTPCQQLVFGGDADDPDELNAAKLLNLMIRHRCEVEQ